MSTPVFETAHPIIKAWLERCTEHHEIAATADYLLYAFRRDDLGGGTLELIDHRDLSQGHDVLAMALALTLPAPETQEDFLALLSLCEWTYNANLVWKDLDGSGGFAVQLKVSAKDLTLEALDSLYKRLLQAKRFIEEE